MKRRQLSADDLCKQRTLAEPGSAYTDKDRKLIRELVRQVVDPTNSKSSFFAPPPCSPEVRGLLFVDEEHVVERSTQVVAATNLVVSLVLSGVLESCLRPVPVADFTNPRDRILVEIYNTLGGAVLTLTLGCSLYTTYFLISLPTESPSTIYTGLANGSRHFVTFQMLTGASVFMLIAMICIGAAIWSSTTGFIITCSVVVVLWTYTTISFVRAYRAFCPSSWVTWSAFYPGTRTKSLMEECSRLGRIRLAEAPHLAEIMNSDPLLESRQNPMTTASTTSEKVGSPPSDEELSALRSLLTSAVPSMQQHRVEVVAKEMLLESMTVGTLKETASCEGGLRLIYDALNFEDAALLRRGERMAVASLLQKQLRTAEGSGEGGALGETASNPSWQDPNKGYELRYHSM